MRFFRSPVSTLLPAAAALLIILFSVSGCERGVYYLDVTPDPAGVDFTDNGSVTSISVSADFQGSLIDADGRTPEKRYEVDLYVSLKKSGELTITDNTIIQTLYSETFQINQSSENSAIYSHDITTEELTAGYYWFEFVWLDDNGGHLAESGHTELVP